MMFPLVKLKRSYIWPIPLLITVNVVILTLPPSGLRYGAALILLGFLPGWIWLQAFFDHPHDIAERVTLAVGLSLALSIVAAMVAAYLPGPLTAAQLLIIANIIIIPGLLLTWRNRAATTHNHQAEMSAKTFSLWQYYLILAALLLLAAGLRLPRLGYAEFHEDEAEALMLGPRLFQGEDYALFLHRKGPAQMLVPVSMWLLTGQIDETLARLPFTLSSILSVATLFFLGRRWFNNWAGITAALLWATNGYAIGFGRMAQYQALIFFMGPLALYCLYLAWAQRQPRYYVPVAILLAACLLAHFDALLLLPAVGYLALKGLKDEGRRLNKFFLLSNFSFLLSLGLFLVLVASFYLPYLLDPEFKNTLTYLSESRVKPGLLYDNLSLLRRLDSAYSSRFYLPHEHASTWRGHRSRRLVP